MKMESQKGPQKKGQSGPTLGVTQTRGTEKGKKIGKGRSPLIFSLERGRSARKVLSRFERKGTPISDKKEGEGLDRGTFAGPQEKGTEGEAGEKS